MTKLTLHAVIEHQLRNITIGFLNFVKLPNCDFFPTK